MKNSPSRRLAAVLLFALAVSIPALPGAAPQSDGNVIVPTKPIILFNGKDFTNFYTWLGDHKYQDPNRVFTVVQAIDGAPAIRVSGQDWGGVITKEAYANYHLIVEFRYGLLTWDPRRDRAMDSGILLHCQPPDGNAKPDRSSPWMHSIEYQIMEGATGDFIRVAGYLKEGEKPVTPSLTGKVRQKHNGLDYWDPNGVEKTYTTSGRLQWSGRDPDHTGKLGFRGPADVEKPVGQWNRIEITCKGDSLTYYLNGQMINQATRASLTSGRILFQSEGAEVFFRRIELHPVR